MSTVGMLMAVVNQDYNSGALPAGMGGTSLSGGPPSYSYHALNLPPGLSFDRGTRSIIGRPTTVGEWTVTYNVTTVVDSGLDRGRGATTVEQTFVFKVKAATTTPPVTPTDTPTPTPTPTEVPTEPVTPEPVTPPPVTPTDTPTPTPVPPPPKPEECTCPDDSAGPLSHDSSTKTSSRSVSDESDTLTNPIAVCITLLPTNLDPNEDKDNDPATFDEGTKAWFHLTASRAPTTDLTVKMKVTNRDWPVIPAVEMGDQEVAFLTTYGTAVSVEIPTLPKDGIDELDGTITVTLQDGSGYVVGSPSTVVLTVKDRPETPTNLRGNGHLVADPGLTIQLGLPTTSQRGFATLRWAAEVQDLNPRGTRADPTSPTTYRAQFAQETCDQDGCTTGAWATIDLTSSTSGGTNEARFGFLRDRTLYRVRVQAVVVDESGWSNEVVVYTTMTHPTVQGTEDGRGTIVATIPLRRYQADGQLALTICNPPAPTSPPLELPADAAQPLPAGVSVNTMKGIIEEWEDATVWAGPGGTNIISSSLTSSTTCPSPTRAGARRIYVVTQEIMGFVCDNARFTGCWRSNGTLTHAITQNQQMLLRVTPSLFPSWTTIITPAGPDCTYFKWVLSHETGHGYGLGHGKTEDSHVSDDPVNYDLCGPTIYDTAAILAIYQSR